MAAETSAELRAQGAHARHLADNMHNQEAEVELRQIADSLDADADGLENGATGLPIQPPAQL